MLALKSKLTLSLLMATTFMMVFGTAFGQQTPAQRYEPVLDDSFRGAPPSVHVAPQQIQKLSEQLRAARENDSKSSTGVNSRQSRTSFTFSDTPRGGQTLNQSPASGIRVPARPAPRQYRSSIGTANAIQQASFQDDRNGEPSVPAILADKSKLRQTAAQQPTTNGFQAPKTPPFLTTNHGVPTIEEFPRKSPADFDAQMKQASGSLQQAFPGTLTGQQDDISAQMAEASRRVKEKFKPQSELDSQIDAKQAAPETAELYRQDAIRPATGNVANDLPSGQIPATAGADWNASETNAANAISASDFIGQIAAENAPFAAPIAPVQDPNTAPKLFAKQGADVRPVSAVMQLASGKETDTHETVRDTQVRNVSAETDNLTSASIILAAPAIEVETIGPQSIGINKPVHYQVIVRNHSTTIAERILVGVNLPAWIDIENVNMTTGGKELTNGQNQARLVWSIDQIPGNAAQTITITAVPRKAELFDLGVEWTFVPRVGKAAITVTEPKLEMNISGPMEVLYGETALYHVTVRNPGTGDAENVFVMLPESLGGDRQTLGNIKAGKEKNFQVELLARTAGDLKLIATATGDGKLKTSAERALTVRRAILGVSLDGPGLKYSGSVARYLVEITNTGDAPAAEVVTAVALPPGVKYLGGIESVKLIEGGMRWPVGSLEPGQTRKYTINCQLDTSGDLQLEVGARGKGDLAASSACLTTVETVADLVLTVADPKGPLPTGEEIPYEIKVRNRGSKAAKAVHLVMQFSEGIEPKTASGPEYKIVPGQVLFSPIQEIEPGQEVTFKVIALAMKSGTHIFRAQLTCEDADTREIAEGTTRFFGEPVQPATKAKTVVDSNEFRADLGNEQFKR